jgi:hypothetical protein
VTKNWCYVSCDPEWIGGDDFYWGRLMAAGLLGSVAVAIYWLLEVLAKHWREHVRELQTAGRKG